MNDRGRKNRKQKTDWKTGRMRSGSTFCAFTAWFLILFLFWNTGQWAKQSGGNCDTPSTALRDLYLFGSTYGPMAGFCEYNRTFSFSDESHTTNYVLVNILWVRPYVFIQWWITQN